jgi:hypothetical protein
MAGMNHITSAAVVCEADQRQPGKRPDAAARWRKLLEDQRVSGLPISVFCRERGVPASSLFAWRRRLKLPGGGGAQTFKPVELVGAPKRPRPAPAPGPAPADGDGDADVDVDAGGDAIELCLAAGPAGRRRRLVVRRGFDRQLLADLVQTLESLT